MSLLIHFHCFFFHLLNLKFFRRASFRNSSPAHCRPPHLTGNRESGRWGHGYEAPFLNAVNGLLIIQPARSTGDAKQLWKDFNIDVKSCVELSYVAKAVHGAWPSTKVPFRRRLLNPWWWLSPPRIVLFSNHISLAQLTDHFLGEHLDKTRGARDWTAELGPTELDCKCTFSFFHSDIL